MDNTLQLEVNQENSEIENAFFYNERMISKSYALPILHPVIKNIICSSMVGL